jgi:hypothetical protein
MYQKPVMNFFPLKTGILIFCFWLCLCHLSAQVVETYSSKGLQPNILRKIAMQDASSVNCWWWSWLGGYSAATIGQGIAGITADKLSFRQDMFLSAATTFLGAAGQLVSPVQPVKFRKWKDMGNAVGSEQTRNEEYLKYLEKMAAAEKKGRGWQMHLASGAVNLTSGLVTWLGFKRTWKDGLLNFALNTVVTEVQIWSQPVKAKKYYSNILKQGMIPDSFLHQRDPGYSFSIGTSGNGIRLALSF